MVRHDSCLCMAPSYADAMVCHPSPAPQRAQCMCPNLQQSSSATSRCVALILPWPHPTALNRWRGERSASLRQSPCARPPPAPSRSWQVIICWNQTPSPKLALACWWLLQCWVGVLGRAACTFAAQGAAACHQLGSSPQLAPGLACWQHVAGGLSSWVHGRRSVVACSVCSLWG